MLIPNSQFLKFIFIFIFFHFKFILFIFIFKLRTFLATPHDMQGLTPWPRIELVEVQIFNHWITREVPQTSNYDPLFPSGNHKFVLCVCGSISVLFVSLFV